MTDYITTKNDWQILRDMIADEGNAFSIHDKIWDDYTDFPKDSFKGECGTPACILGWSDMHPNLNFRRYAWVTNDRNFEEISTPIESCKTNGNNFAINPEWFTRARTIAMLDHVIETLDETTGDYDVDWMALEKQQ